MVRTNLVLDRELLEAATHTLGVKTYSAAVNTALAEVLRVRTIQGLSQFFGQGLWEGELSEMRRDSGDSAAPARPGPGGAIAPDRS